MCSVVDGDGDCRGAAREVIQPASPRLAAHQTVIQLETIPKISSTPNCDSAATMPKMHTRLWFC